MNCPDCGKKLKWLFDYIGNTFDSWYECENCGKILMDNGRDYGKDNIRATLSQKAVQMENH
jgi:uncharacterized Zn finger protein